MPINATNRNANSEPTASAAGQSTATPSAGPLPVSALADALVKSGGQFADEDETQVPPASSDAGREDFSDAGNEGEDQPDNTNDLAPDNQQSEEQDQSEEGEGQGDQDANESQEPKGLQPIGVKKRIGQLQAQIRELQNKLKEVQQEPAPAPEAQNTNDPMADVYDPAEVRRKVTQAEDGIEEAEMLLARLPLAPERVERYLRQKGIQLTDPDTGEEDFSPERMADALAGAKQRMKGIVRAGSRRQEPCRV